MTLAVGWMGLSRLASAAPTPRIAGELGPGGAWKWTAAFDAPRTAADPLEVNVRVAPPHSYDVQLLAPITAAVARGDVLWVKFDVRMIARNPDSRGTVVFESTLPPNLKSLSFTFRPTERWQTIALPFRAREDAAPGAARIGVRLGFTRQRLQFRQFELLDYGPAANPTSLTTSGPSYSGRELDAGWRALALQRVDAIRKGLLHLRVVDEQGAAVVGAQLRVSQTKHAFRFGTAVAAQLLSDSSPDGQRYRSTMRSLFNAAVLENDLKWPNWQMHADVARAGLAFLRAHGLPVRGHNLVWPRWKELPESIATLRGDPDRLRQAILAHIREEAGGLGDGISEWDVVNEPYQSRDVVQELGESALHSWFAAARQAAPAAKLFVNETGLIGDTPADEDEAPKRLEYLGRILHSSPEIDAVGVQGHFGYDLPSPEMLQASFNAVAALGRPIEITELDVAVPDARLQADFLRDFLISAFSNPHISGVMLWGFWAGRHWIPDAALFDKDWTPRPSALAFSDVTQRLFWTDTQGTTDATGALRVRAFFGDYLVTASIGGRDLTQQVHFDSTTGPVVLHLSGRQP